MNETELKTLSNQSLIRKTEMLVREERRISTEVLHCLREVEARVLFVDLGFRSLHEFCVGYLKYSEGSTHRRISAMRLLKNLPVEIRNDAETKMNDGAITMTNLTVLQDFFRMEKREFGKIYSNEEKGELIQSLAGRSKREVEKQLAAIQPKLLTRESERVITDTMTEIKFIADEKLMAKLTRVREISAHKDAHGIAELLHLMADEYIKRNDPLEKAKRISTSLATKRRVEVAITEKSRSSSIVHQRSSNRSIPSSVRHEVWLRDGGRCTFVHHQTQQKCGSKYGLEVDHIEPFALGGEHEPKNLRLLCRQHNQYRAKKNFG